MEVTFLVPSTTRSIGGVISLYEYGGSEEYAIRGETGLVCAPRDVAGMAERIERLVHDDALRVRVATAGRALVRERYDWDRSARELEQYLEGYAPDAEASWSDAV